MSSFRDSLDPFSTFWQPGSGDAPGDALLGKNGDSGGIDPSSYLPLIERQAEVNRVNTVNPYGSSFFVDNSQIGNVLSGPQSGGSTGVSGQTNLSPSGASVVGRSNYTPPAYNPSLSGPENEAISRLAYQNAASSGQNMNVSQNRNTGLANTQRSGITGLDPNGVTQVTSLSSELQPLLGQQIGIAGGSPYGEGQAATRAMLSRALNPEQTNASVRDATYAQAMDLLNPEFDKQSRQFEQKLANQGIQVGNEAYSGAYRDMSSAQDRARQNAAYQAVTAGQQAALSERGQNINELNLAANQGLQGNMSQSQLIAQLLSGNQPGGIQPIDVTGPANLAANQNMAQQQIQQQNKNSNTQAGVGLGSAAMTAMAASDRRLKTDIVPVGVVNGIMRYLFRFKDWAIKEFNLPESIQYGVMSDEVRHIPGAVFTGPDGYDRVIYGVIYA